jgi:hypothetical protein
MASVDYAADIQPLFDRYCVACHACFDAPCQLDLTEAAGVTRGASKQPVYDGCRLETAEPTRLSIDAGTTADWRKRGFFSVLGGGDQTSVLVRLLDAAHARSPQPNRPLPTDMDIGIGRAHVCADPSEIEEILDDNPHPGMPFALPAMPSGDVEKVRAWIAQGAPVAVPEVVIPAAEAAQILRWEEWLNDRRLRRALTARWLYEHWAIARLHFDNQNTGHFFRLVRSRTPSGVPVDEIATRHPNSDPGGVFYYRFRRQPGTRVYKTHIRFALNPALLQRIEQSFFTEDWDVDGLPGYSDSERANPFVTFAAIPAIARYRFMLEHAGYFVRTFIRGPVCRGQLATDVIRDHFWVMFQDPKSDPYVRDAAFRAQVDGLLALPGIDSDLLGAAEGWIGSTEARNRYAMLRDEQLANAQPQGAAVDAIWDGDGSNENALLTVFRHHDSASVRHGWLGQLPLTAWWLDYPLFERSYYNLRFAGINRNPDPVNRREDSPRFAWEEQLRALSDVPAASMPAIAHLPDASLLRVVGQDGTREVSTVIRNRRHSNVAFVLGESLRYEPDKDTLSILPGVVTGYPNFIIDVPADAIASFVAALRGEPAGAGDAFARHIVDVWGVRRSAPAFWSIFHDINDYLVEADPPESGLLDLNRYVDYPAAEQGVFAVGGAAWLFSHTQHPR